MLDLLLTGRTCPIASVSQDEWQNFSVEQELFDYLDTEENTFSIEDNIIYINTLLSINTEILRYFKTILEADQSETTQTQFGETIDKIVSFTCSHSVPQNITPILSIPKYKQFIDINVIAISNAYQLLSEAALKHNCPYIGQIISCFISMISSASVKYEILRSDSPLTIASKINRSVDLDSDTIKNADKDSFEFFTLMANSLRYETAKKNPMIGLLLGVATLCDLNEEMFDEISSALEVEEAAKPKAKPKAKITRSKAKKAEAALAPTEAKVEVEAEAKPKAKIARSKFKKAEAPVEPTEAIFEVETEAKPKAKTARSKSKKADAPIELTEVKVEAETEAKPKAKTTRSKAKKADTPVEAIKAKVEVETDAKPKAKTTRSKAKKAAAAVEPIEAIVEGEIEAKPKAKTKTTRSKAKKTEAPVESIEAKVEVETEAKPKAKTTRSRAKKAEAAIETTEAKPKAKTTRSKSKKAEATVETTETKAEVETEAKPKAKTTRSKAKKAEA